MHADCGERGVGACRHRGSTECCTTREETSGRVNFSNDLKSAERDLFLLILVEVGIIR
jgi:hypothetical protein